LVFKLAVLAVSIGLVTLGMKGFTASGIRLSKTVVLKGTSAKMVGVVCILAGLAFIAALLLGFLAFDRWLDPSP